MSNFDSIENRPKKSKRTQNSSAPAKTAARVRWSYIQADLDSAASEWSQAESSPPGKTPEEMQLEKVKNIIEDLKEKLDKF